MAIDISSLAGSNIDTVSTPSRFLPVCGWVDRRVGPWPCFRGPGAVDTSREGETEDDAVLDAVEKGYDSPARSALAYSLGSKSGTAKTL